MFGQIKLRSFKAILEFIGRGIDEEPEFDVDPDPRTGTGGRQSGQDPDHPGITHPTRRSHHLRSETRVVVLHRPGIRGRRIAVDRWNHEAFDLLYQLYHLTVTDISKIPSLPIAISK